MRKLLCNQMLMTKVKKHFQCPVCSDTDLAQGKLMRHGWETGGTMFQSCLKAEGIFPTVLQLPD